MLKDIDGIDFVAIFAMDPGSGAGVTMNWDAYMELSRAAMRLRGNDVRLVGL